MSRIDQRLAPFEGDYVHMDTPSRRAPRYCRRIKNNQARLRLVVINDSMGYKSGLNSCRETPDMASMDSTRSAGTRPERRHFCTAWYETEHRAAKGKRPPPPLIARSTTLMEPILQPIVALRQQPIRACQAASMQLMVVRTKEEARAEFARNLNRELDRLSAPRRGRPGWLREKLSNAVSRESCRKWLAGEDLPDQGNMSILIDTLDLNQQLLRTGSWEPAPSSKDQRFMELEKAWPHLEDPAREAIMMVLRATRSVAPLVQTKRKRG